MTLQVMGGQGPGKSHLLEGHSLEVGEPPHSGGGAWLPPPCCDRGCYAAISCGQITDFSEGQPEWEASTFPCPHQGMALGTLWGRSSSQ